jgi:hypothetical protein
MFFLIFSCLAFQSFTATSDPDSPTTNATTNVSVYLASPQPKALRLFILCVGLLCRIANTPKDKNKLFPLLSSSIPLNSVDIHPSLAIFIMESDESSQQLESQLTQQPATQQLQQVPENTEKTSKKTKRKRQLVAIRARRSTSSTNH